MTMINNHKAVSIHILIWALIYFYLNLSAPYPNSIIPRLICNGFKVLNYMYAFYSLRYLVFQKYWEYNKAILVIFSLFIYASFTFFLVLINVKVFPFLGRRNVFEGMPFHIQLLNSFYFFALNGGLATSLFINKYSINKLKQHEDNENALVKREISLLKNQFNSHITFNFLNYVYSHVLKISERAAEPIEMYADMLRYTLTIKPEEKVSLEQEIDYITNFIEIQKLISSKVYVNFQIKGQIKDIYIIPRLLITLVENTFLHGEFNSPDKPIEILITTSARRLYFETKNTKKEQKNNDNNGTGLKNLNDMLDLFYKDRYEFKTSKQADTFIAKLTINLHDNNNPNINA